jgi:LEA14-like dessication related protein
MSGFRLGTEVVFHNPNMLKFKIQNVGLDLYLDNKKMAAINEKREILVRRKSDFAIPISVTIKPEMSILDGLKEIYKAFTSKEMEMHINGGVGVKWLFWKKNLGIDINKKVKF